MVDKSRELNPDDVSVTSSVQFSPEHQIARAGVEKRTPQESVDRFWKKFYDPNPGKVFTVLPENPFSQKIAKAPERVAQAQRAVKSYEQAREECLKDVERIARECRRGNRKYRDAHFDIEIDLKAGTRNCLEGLERPHEEYSPKAVKRINEIFDKPQFFVHGASAGDVVQGGLGDCYLMAALCGLGGMAGLIDKVCVVQEPEVGVYGFVFHRDGEWQQCIVDDQLYLTAPDYDESCMERQVWDNIARRDTEEEYRRTNQTGSRSLYFAKCSDPNETWLPLLEKAYAKAHGDYASLSGGFTGEAIEDLTGGVTSELRTADIFDKGTFWTNEILQVGKEFLWGCTTGLDANWLEPNRTTYERQGVVEGHAYSIIDAVEHTVDGKLYRLVKVRNPWGQHGWHGAWSDGSAEWTPQWMERLDHKFGDDGVFWMSYDDLLKKFQHLDRTRIFGPQWSIAQQWTSVHVPWTPDYHQTRYSIAVTKSTPVVIVLSQLDRRYFVGLEGQYNFRLQFRVHKAGEDDDYIVRSDPPYYTARSVSTDIFLEEGSYILLMKVIASPRRSAPTETLVARHAQHRQEKLIQVGLSYDVAHAKGIIVESAEQKRAQKKNAKAKAAALREKMKEEVKAQAEKECRKKNRQIRRYETRVRRTNARFRSCRSGHEQREQGDNSGGPEGEEIHGGNDVSAADDSRSFADGSRASYEESHPVPLPPLHQNDQETNDAMLGKERKASDQGSHEQSPSESGREPADKVEIPNPTVKLNDADTVSCAKAEKRRPLLLKDTQSTQPSDREATALPFREREGAEADRASFSSTPDMSDLDSLHNFDWQTDLDYDSDHHAERLKQRHIVEAERAADEARREYEKDCRHKDDDNANIINSNDSDISSSSSSSNDGNNNDKPGQTSNLKPWNAVCVVGLRVYSQDPSLSLQVVRPNQCHGSANDGAEQSNDDVGRTANTGRLDRDDPAKGAMTERWAKTPARSGFDNTEAADGKLGGDSQ